jgi:hypothetical protein
MKTFNACTTVIQLIATTLAGLLLSGCLGYSLGTTLPHDIRTIHVPTFKNSTTEPLLEIDTTDATIGRFQFDGSVQITQENEADAILKVTLISYTLTPLSFDPNKTTQTREYRATVKADVVLLRRATDEVILDAPSVIGEATFYLTGDMSSSKRRAMPELSEDLGRRIVDTVTQTWQ